MCTNKLRGGNTINIFSNATNFEIINTVSSVFTAIGTVTISAIALWLSWKDRLIRIKAVFNNCLIPGNNPHILDREVYTLAFTNIGQRTAYVTNYEWNIRSFPKIWLFNRCITFPYMESTLSHLCSKFPYELTPGKEGYLFHTSTFFEDLEAKEQHLYTSSKYLAFYRIFIFRITIKTSVDKNVNVKIPYRVRKLLWKRYKKHISG